MAAASSPAAPKYAPCARPATNRPARINPNVGASAEATVPTVNIMSNPSTSLRRGTRAVSAAIVGAPTTTPSA